MNARPFLQTLGLISATLLLAACSSKQKPVEVSGNDLVRGEGSRGVTTATYKEGVPGGVINNTYAMTATVTAIDPATRKITLAEPGGKKTTIRAGSAVQNFDQIKVGDTVKANVDTEVVISVKPGGGPTANARSTTISPAAKGDKPGLDIMDMADMTGTVTAVDAGDQRATIRFPDGQTVNVKARPDVDLSKVKKGDDVFIHATQAVAIAVVSPQAQ